MTDDLHPALGRAFATLSGANVRWALMRLPRSLARLDGDVDLLVHPEDGGRARSALLATGLAPIASSGPGWPHIAYDEASGDWLHLDPTPQALPPGFRADATLTQDVLRRRRLTDGVWRLSPTDEFWLLLAHVADRGRLATRHWHALRAAAPMAGSSPVRDVLARQPGAVDALSDARDAVLVDDLHGLRRAIDRLGPSRSADRGPGRLVSIARRPVDAWRHRGMSVALLGPDGAGKSTLARRLIARSFVPTSVIYMGTGVPGELTARPVPLRILRGPVLFSVGGIATQWLRYFRGVAERLRGRMVVFDRYTEEAWLPPNQADPVWRRIGRLARRLVACPPPDLAIVLDVPGVEMFRRKGEHDDEMLESERARYRQLAARLPSVIVIDATMSEEGVCDAAMAGIWATYRGRWVRHQADAGREST